MKRIDESVGDFLKKVNYKNEREKSSQQTASLLYNIYLRTDTNLNFKEWIDSIFDEYRTDGEMKIMLFG